MKKILAISLLLLAFSWTAFAETIIFKDGMRVEVSEVWKEGGEIRCRIGDVVFGYPKSEVERIEKGRAEGSKAAPPVLKVHKEVTAAPQKKTAIQKKGTAGPDKGAGISGIAAAPPKKETAASKKQITAPKQKTVVSKKETPVPKKEVKAAKKETVIPKKETTVSSEPKAVLQKAVSIPAKKKKEAPVKVISVSKKKKPQKAIAAKYASIPSFKVLINEDENNPPVYIKRRRVLLVSRGLAKAQIRTVLLSYEKKIRNELKAQKARYKQIMIWVYDDFERADEGAGGWVGMITNDPKTGNLSDNPIVLLK